MCRPNVVPQSRNRVILEVVAAGGLGLGRDREASVRRDVRQGRSAHVLASATCHYIHRDPPVPGLSRYWIGKMTNRIDARIIVREVHPYGSSFDLLSRSTSPSSMCLSPQSRQSKMNRSGNPPKRVVRRMSCMGATRATRRLRRWLPCELFPHDPPSNSIIGLPKPARSLVNFKQSFEFLNVRWLV